MLSRALSLAPFGFLAAAAGLVQLRSADGINVLSVDTYAKETVYQLGNVTYFSPLSETAVVLDNSDALSSSAPTPATVIALGSSAGVVDLTSILADYAAKDDVYTEAFLSTVILHSFTSVDITQETVDYLLGKGAETIILKGALTTSSSNHAAVKYTGATGAPAPGPYLALKGAKGISLHPVYRLEVDKFRTFTAGVYAVGDGHAALGRVSAEFGDPWVPVPSRLYTLCSGKPLAGVRVAVKDIYDVKGVQTAAGSRAFAELYPIASVNAPSVQKLIDLGVVIVGKTKTAQFASGASVNDGTLEVQYPFSPRSDLWQSCGASSSGSGCAVAAYDWLDFALGTDTGGSVRIPSAVSGLYGNRPTSGAITLQNVLPLTPVLDTLGVIARDPTQWTNIIRHCFPKKLIYPTNYMPHGTSEARKLKEDFIVALQAQFGMTREDRNFTAAVATSNNTIAQLVSSYAMLTGWDQYTLVAQDLIAKYGAANGGRYPPTDTARRGNFKNSAANQSQALYDEALRITKDHRQWFNNVFFVPDEQSCSDSIYVYDVGTGGLPSYREQVLNDGVTALTPFTDPLRNTLVQHFVSPMGGNVDITIPIGQVPYNSTVSGVIEYHPVTISLMSRAGCDFMLLDMVDELAKAGLVTKVKTGRTPF